MKIPRFIEVLFLLHYVCVMPSVFQEPPTECTAKNVCIMATLYLFMFTNFYGKINVALC